MAFIRKRRTSSGNLSAALVEPYRDSAGRPRQRVLANLYVCETTLEALAKLSAQRQRLRQERGQIASMLKQTDEWAAAAINIAADSAKARQLDLSPQERRELGEILKGRKKAKARLARIETLLKRVQNDGAVIRKHVAATENEIQQAIKDYQERLHEAEMMIQGINMSASMAKREFARLSLPGEAHKSIDIDKDIIRSVVAEAEKARRA